jgi:hypothetical protein
MGTKGTLTKKFHEVVRDLKARDHWRAADGYFEDLFVSGDPVLAAALAASDAEEYLEHLARQEHVNSTVIQTVGGKHHDGFSVSIVGTAPATERARTNPSKSRSGKATQESASRLPT